MDAITNLISRIKSRWNGEKTNDTEFDIIKILELMHERMIEIDYDMQHPKSGRVLEILNAKIEDLEGEVKYFEEKNHVWCKKYESEVATHKALTNLMRDLNISRNEQLSDLYQECKKLREQLRWHDAKKEPPNKSGHYIVMTTLGMLALMYYNYTSTYGWSTPGIVSKWCYIPDDNQGDCTQERE